MYRFIVSTLLAAAVNTAAATDLEQLVPQLASRVDGPGPGALAGTAVSSAGDFNGDGFADLLIGAPGAARGATANVGAAYVVYGTAVGIPDVTLDVLTPASGVAITSAGAAAGKAIGIAVADAGDFNGDGYDDIVVGSGIGQFGSAQPGTAWIVFGRSGAATIDLDALGTAGVTLTGAGSGDGFGTVLAGGGSFNGDPWPDVALAAPFGAGLNGEAYVVFGTATPPAAVAVALLNGLDGTILREPESFNLTGISLALDGDSNADGRADLLVGSFGMIDAQQRSVGGAYLVHGRATFPPNIDLGGLNGTDGARFVGTFYSQSGADSAGSAVAFLGDQDGDGRDELVIADPDASPNGRRFSGEVFVVKGLAGYAAVRDLGSLSAAEGWRVQGASGGDKAGASLAAQADVNRDGRADLVIAAPQTTDSTPVGPGRVAILFDLTTRTGLIDLMALAQGRRDGELLAGRPDSRDLGSLAALCRDACAGPTLAIGAAADNANAGAVHVLRATDRVFFDGFD